MRMGAVMGGIRGVALRKYAGQPGAVSNLFRQLHRLHRYAGEPSMRAIADATHNTLSHTAVHMALTGSRGVPSWSILYAVVLALGGDVEDFRELWVLARDEEDGDGSSGGDLSPPTVRATFPLVAPRSVNAATPRPPSERGGGDLANSSQLPMHANRRDLAEYIVNASPRKAAHLIKSLPLAVAHPVLNSIPPEVARGAVLAGDREVAQRLLLHLNPRRAGTLLSMLPLQVAVDAMSGLPAVEAAQVLSATGPSPAAHFLAELRPTATRAEIVNNLPAHFLVAVTGQAHVTQNVQILPSVTQDAEKLGAVLDGLRVSALRTVLDVMPMSDVVALLEVELQPLAFRKLAQCITPSRLALALGEMPSVSAAFLLAAIPQNERKIVLNQVSHRARIHLMASLRVAQRALIGSAADSLGLHPSRI